MSLQQRIILTVLVLAGNTAFGALWLGAPERPAQEIPQLEKLGDCLPSNSDKDLNINNVRAKILGGGDMWWDGVNDAQYEVPKIDPSSGQTPVNAIFAGALWFSALDDAGQLKVAAQTYRNQGHDFWTGPLRPDGEIDKSTCAAWDNHFEVLGEDIDNFLLAFQEAGGVSLAESQIPTSVKNWPGRGNPLVSSELYYNDGPLAPFFDFDDNGIYDPRKGDYPVIGVKDDNGNTVPNYADQMIFWVMNDKGNIHGRTGGQALGVQVNAIAFAFQTNDEVNNMTFYSFDIVKKTPGSLNETYMGVFCDPDLGDFEDDWIGCDTSRALGFVYNSQASDDQYGTPPPVLGIDYFEGPLDDNGNELGMSSFVYFNNAASGPQTDPDNAAQFRNFQTGLWKDGTPITEDGTGYGGTVPTNYVYPSNPSDPAGWSECSESIPGDDRRFVQNSGPFTLRNGEFQKITIGAIWVKPDNYGLCPDIEAIIGRADDRAQFLFDNNFDKLDGPDAPDLNVRELNEEFIFTLTYAQNSNNFGENYSENVPGSSGFDDSTYKFQGYLLYQLADATVTAQELSDASRARLLYQCDIKDDIVDIYNYEPLTANGQTIYSPLLKVSGSNEGIERSLQVTTDLFAVGDNKLVNHKDYYYMALAYGYNNFYPYVVDDTSSVVPQYEPYILGQGNIKQYTCTPHRSNPGLGGTELNAVYGQGLPVTRVEGQGNGGNPIEITAESEEEILSSFASYVDDITYKGNKTPIGVRVVDPFALQDVDFELRILPSTNPANVFPSGATWELTVRRDGVVETTIQSERTLDRPFDQIIPEYGIALKLGNPLPVNTNRNNNEDVYGYLTSSIEFADDDQQWLTFITDGSNGGDESPSNWLRSGQFKLFESEYALRRVYDDQYYPTAPAFTNAAQPPSETFFYDANGEFNNILEGQWAPYCLTSNYGRFTSTNLTNPANTNQSTQPPTFLHGPAFKIDDHNKTNGPFRATDFAPPVNTLEKLQSVDIVITPDKSKWSLSLVLETGEEPLFTQGGAYKGQLRQDTSLTISGNIAFGEQGLSYFPGYAINQETGERLNIFFGEASSRGDNNGNNLVWDPTDSRYDILTTIPGTDDNVPAWGGKHYIYVLNSRYDEQFVRDTRDLMENNFNQFSGGNESIPAVFGSIYENFMYTAIPVLTEGTTLERDASTNGRFAIIPTETRIKIRVEKPFAAFGTASSVQASSNDSLPRYSFSTTGLSPTTGAVDVAVEELDNIRVVPNPYYAFSEYEANQLSNIVKFTNLPNICTIKILTLDGKFVRQYDRSVASSDISRGGIVGGDLNLDNSLVWDLKNFAGIPVGSGVYLIHVDVPNVGQKSLKSVVFLRPTDVSDF
ncbi:MAG: hypothetical protein VXY37_02060 [Bacteroidota bacterium]|nr:hypothetical protein [Bacteroidota bacterium]